MLIVVWFFCLVAVQFVGIGLEDVPAGCWQ